MVQALIAPVPIYGFPHGVWEWSGNLGNIVVLRLRGMGASSKRDRILTVLHLPVAGVGMLTMTLKNQFLGSDQLLKVLENEIASDLQAFITRCDLNVGAERIQLCYWSTSSLKWCVIIAHIGATQSRLKLLRAPSTYRDTDVSEKRHLLLARSIL